MWGRMVGCNHNEEVRAQVVSTSGEVCECGGHLSRFIEPRLLILLRKGPSHGYELIEKMDDFPFSDRPSDPGAVYRTLRAMENEGLVKSKWDTGESGPARRIYTLTKEGEERLYAWVVSFKKRLDAIEKFLKFYERG